MIADINLWIVFKFVDAKDPKVRSTELENIPAIFFYFDDSPVPLPIFCSPKGSWTDVGGIR